MSLSGALYPCPVMRLQEIVTKLPMSGDALVGAAAHTWERTHKSRCERCKWQP